MVCLCGLTSWLMVRYDLMSTRVFTHATPTLFNSGTPHPQMSSCFLLSMKGDSIEGIYDTLKQCGLSVTPARSAPRVI